MEFEDIIYEKKEGVAKITINRPAKRNALRGITWSELYKALLDATLDRSMGVIVLTGAGDKAFCSGADQNEQESDEYRLVSKGVASAIFDAPKPVIAAVKGYAIGGGNWLHCICDLTIASDNAIFGQVGPRVGSSMPAWMLPYQALVIGQKKVREMWFLCRQYNAQQALEMGMVNTVVPLDKLEAEVDKWCQEILALSPTCLRHNKAGLNLALGHLHTIDSIGETISPGFWDSEESKEGARAFLEKRKPDFSKFRR